MTYGNVSWSFETPSCFRNVSTLHELVCLRKVVTRSLTRFLLVNATCRHVRRKRHAVIWTCVLTQEANGDLRRKTLLWTRHTTSVSSVSRMTKDITDLVVYETWKSVLLSPNRGCENTFCCSTPDLLDVFHVLLPLLPSFTSQHCGSEGRVRVYLQLVCSKFVQN